MNLPWVHFHLKEAADELHKIIRQIEDGAIGKDEFEIAVTHAYHHLNTAWNSRFITDDKARNHTDWDYNEWRQFPRDLNLR
jgi:hypothetical protein